LHIERVHLELEIFEEAGEPLGRHLGIVPQFTKGQGIQSENAEGASDGDGAADPDGSGETPEPTRGTQPSHEATAGRARVLPGPGDTDIGFWFVQRGALLKEPVEANSRHPNEISRRRYGIH
jgi:hypothetical protein